MKKNNLALMVIAFSALLAACSSAPKVIEGLSTQDIAGHPLYHQYVVHPQDRDKKIEFYWQAPQVQGKFPVVFVLHGHQDPDRPGGAIWTHGWMQKMVADHFIPVAISQPGNGNSEGPADYCGPYTIRGIREVIRYFKTLKFVDPAHMAIYGVGRGATCAALVGAQEPSLAALVLQVGLYDLKDDFDYVKNSTDKDAKLLAEKIERETGASEEALDERSVLGVISKIKAPTFVITGDNDPISQRSSVAFAQALQDSGVTVKLESYKKQGHVIPEHVTFDDIAGFLENHLQDTGPLNFMPAPSTD